MVASASWGRYQRRRGAEVLHTRVAALGLWVVQDLRAAEATVHGPGTVRRSGDLQAMRRLTFLSCSARRANFSERASNCSSMLGARSSTAERSPQGEAPGIATLSGPSLYAAGPSSN